MTSLYGGRRIPKFHARMDVVGTLDELNATIGLVVSELTDEGIREMLTSVQNTLFNIGAEVAEGGTKVGRMIDDSLRVSEGMDATLEEWIDRFDEELPQLTNFILPGGSPVGARLHHARTVCRRAERTLAVLSEKESANPHSLKYVNRLSDLLFVLARTVNHRAGVVEQSWNR